MSRELVFVSSVSCEGRAPSASAQFAGSDAKKCSAPAANRASSGLDARLLANFIEAKGGACKTNFGFTLRGDKHLLGLPGSSRILTMYFIDFQCVCILDAQQKLNAGKSR